MLTTGLSQYMLSNGKVRIGIIPLGATINLLETPDREGRWKNIVAGYTDPEAYWQNKYYFGCVIGRYANRIGGGQFLLNGKPVQLSVNNAGNHLHGGFEGLHRKIWTLHSRINTDGATGIVLEYCSPDGEEGYPGNLRVQVSYQLDMDGRFSIGYMATTDKDTPVNLTNHTYFNLSGFSDPVIDDHWLQVSSSGYTEKNGLNLPTGRLLPLADTPMDFSTSRRIGDRMGELSADKGFDHNYVLDDSEIAARLYDPGSGRWLQVRTDQPGLQVYTANWWDGSITGQQGIPYVQHGAVALETQAFPDSPNQSLFPDTILRPGEVYRRTTSFEFGFTTK